MKILINYADKQYEPARKWNTLTGRYIARFDKVYEYTPCLLYTSDAADE